jgi:hypothetical protein
MYNNLPIQTIDLADSNSFSKLDASGLVVRTQTHAVGVTSTGINLTNGSQSFVYRPIDILSNNIVSTTVPVPSLPYQEYLLLNTTSSPVTYTLPNSHIMYYDGVSHTSVTIHKTGQNITLASLGTNVFYVVQTSGTVNNSNIQFN